MKPRSTGSVRAGLRRILVVNWQDRENPRAGGAEEHLHRIFGALARRGHEVTLLASGWKGAKGRTRLDNIAVHRCGGRNTFGFAAPLYYRRNLGRASFDVVVEDFNKAPMCAHLWARSPIKLLIVHHLFGRVAFQAAPPLQAFIGWAGERMIPWLYRSLECAAVSEGTRDELVQVGMPAGRIRVIHNGVELDALRPGDDRTRRPSILFLGRLRRYKRVDLVLEALAVLLRKGLDVRLEIAGRGDDAARLRRRVSSSGLSGRVRFAGYVTEERKARLLRRSWVHVLASPKEGWGISSMEASASGTPTVASDSPGLRETVRHGETGLLVPHGDVAALAEALERILTEPELRDRMGRAARRMAEEFSWERAARGFERWIQEARV